MIKCLFNLLFSVFYIDSNFFTHFFVISWINDFFFYPFSTPFYKYKMQTFSYIFRHTCFLLKKEIRSKKLKIAFYHFSLFYQIYFTILMSTLCLVFFKSKLKFTPFSLHPFRFFIGFKFWWSKTEREKPLSISLSSVQV